MRNVAVIMAGGSGTRMWPLSRRHRPKQLLHIVEGSSLIHKTYERLNAMLEPQDIYVIALAEHLPAIAEELSALPSENLIGEPTGRDTANAITLAAAILHERDPDTVMGVFTADHLIRPVDTFAEIVRRGYEAAAKTPDALVTFGIKPTEPHVGFGYVERGDEVSPGIWSVASFREKPERATAEQYVASGDYYWNSGMFVWRTATILSQIKQRLPGSHEGATKLAKAWFTPEGPDLANAVYPTLERISIDFAVMENAPKVLVVEMALDWLDVGNWTALTSVLGADADGNTRALSRAATMESNGNILVAEGDHLIATIGVSDLVVVHSANATLVCHKREIQRIKDMVGELDETYDGHYS